MAAFIALSIYVLYVATFLFLCATVRHTALVFVLLVVGLAVGYFAHMGCVVLFFELAFSFAASEAEQDAIIGGDGAKLVFNGLFFAPATSICLCVLGYIVHMCTGSLSDELN